MIYTRFGSEIKIVRGNIDTGEVDIQYPNGKVRETYIHELRATEGIKEIHEAIERAGK